MFSTIRIFSLAFLVCAAPINVTSMENNDRRYVVLNKRFMTWLLIVIATARLCCYYEKSLTEQWSQFQQPIQKKQSLYDLLNDLTMIKDARKQREPNTPPKEVHCTCCIEGLRECKSWPSLRSFFEYIINPTNPMLAYCDNEMPCNELGVISPLQHEIVEYFNTLLGLLQRDIAMQNCYIDVNSSIDRELVKHSITYIANTFAQDLLDNNFYIDVPHIESDPACEDVQIVLPSRAHIVRGMTTINLICAKNMHLSTQAIRNYVALLDLLLVHSIQDTIYELMKNISVTCPHIQCLLNV